MRRAGLAQWILSLATTPDRSATTVGDVLEQSSTLGILWFWSSVVRTACSLCWRDLCSAPRRLAWLGLRGWLESLVFEYAFGMTVIVGSFSILSRLGAPLNTARMPSGASLGVCYGWHRFGYRYSVPGQLEDGPPFQRPRADGRTLGRVGVCRGQCARLARIGDSGPPNRKAVARHGPRIRQNLH